MTPEMIGYYTGQQGIPYIIDELRPERKFLAYVVISSGVPSESALIVHEAQIIYGVPHN